METLKELDELNQYLAIKYLSNKTGDSIYNITLKLRYEKQLYK